MRVSVINACRVIPCIFTSKLGSISACVEAWSLAGARHDCMNVWLRAPLF